MILQGLSSQKYQLDTKPFSIGGEGDIYNVTNVATIVAKIYHADRITKELENKLKIMVKRPPSSGVFTQVAWPLDVIYDSNNQLCGFIMPKLNITEELLELYKYPPQKYKNITTRHKIIIAENICAVISEVHKAGYVFGDFNPRNIGVNLNTGTVAFLDTDSYHIYDRDTNSTYRCKVCLDGYVAPELLKACENYPKDAYATVPLPTFTKETDNFALAIHIFKLLMNGYTPYNGIKEADSASVGAPGVGNNAVKQNSYCFRPGNKPQAVAVPRLDALPQEITDLFTRAFMDGRIDPKQRPAAIEWHSALTKYENSLKTCASNNAHQYKNSLTSCPWCEADERYANLLAPAIGQKTFSAPVIPTPTPSSVNTGYNSTRTNVGTAGQGGIGYTSSTTAPTPRKGLGIGVVVGIGILIILTLCVVVISIPAVINVFTVNTPVISSNYAGNKQAQTGTQVALIYTQSAQTTSPDTAVTGTGKSSIWSEVKPGQGILLDTGRKIINLSDPSGKTFIKTTIVLEFAPNSQDYFNTSEIPPTDGTTLTKTTYKEAYLATFMEGLKANLSIINDVIITSISAKNYDQLYTTEGKETLRQEIVQAVNSRLPEYKVIQVYFSEFVVQ